MQSKLGRVVKELARTIPQSATLTGLSFASVGGNRLPPASTAPLHKGAFERRIVMNFTTWLVIAIAIIVPVATYVFQNKK